MKNVGTENGTVWLVVAAVVVLLIPGVQCANYMSQIAKHNSKAVQIQQDNSDLQKQIKALIEVKSNELIAAVDQINQLEERLERNRDISEKSDDARHRLNLAMMLVEQHREILRELNDLKSNHSELMSSQ